MGNTGGFSGPTSNVVCTVTRLVATNRERFGCTVTLQSTPSANYYVYRLQTYENLPSNTDLEIMVTTQNGNGAEGLAFPSVSGTYKIEAEVKYSSGNSLQVSACHFVDVYGPDFNTLNFISTVNIPEELNMILLELTPSLTVPVNNQLVIEFPTVALDGTLLFGADLGMGYTDYSDLLFDLYESTNLASMQCKVYTGDSANDRPVKIVCSNFNTALTTSTVLKMGFWVRNPPSEVGLAIPIQVYALNQVSMQKTCWSMVEGGVKVLPTSVSPVSITGLFSAGSTMRQISGQNLDFVARNTQNMQKDDLYIMKFNFDLRNSQAQAGKFLYNSGLGNSGDAIFMRNCQTIILRVGLANLTSMASSSTTLNARLNGIFYNPATQLTSA